MKIAPDCQQVLSLWHHSNVDADSIWVDSQVSSNHSLLTDMTIRVRDMILTYSYSIFLTKHFYPFSEGDQSILAYTIESFQEDWQYQVFGEVLVF